ncbi:MAG TPA: 2-oxoacid:acceptor oxidoreductase subunit alpha [Longimicrobiales bacterium]|nr:2-oxoacid:acceptor oxidoreductase subunit alpha [Longimicrobiales bacterium]
MIADPATNAAASNAARRATDAADRATDAPDVATDAPDVATDAPDVATDAPDVATDAPDVATDAPLRVNDFAFRIATVNGTGSASANGLLMQAIFRMGIPVSGKNVFPSNIQGLPTWYEIRVNHRGHVARTPRFDLVVAMNNATYGRDVSELQPGAYVLYDSSWPMPQALDRTDLTFIGIPLARLCAEAFSGGRERLLLKNIAYVGALAALFEIPLEIVDALLAEQFAAKKKLLDANFAAVRIGHDYARAHFACPLPIRLAPMQANGDAVLIDGNTAAALGCVYAGATVGAWYPITPATSLMDAFRSLCARYRRDPDTGENLYHIAQAEDELSAAGIVIGASWAGARAFTPTSGPGISLMSEFIGLAYYAEVPAVFFDVQRTGPSTGMPTRTQQGDLMLTAYASHGDAKHVVLYPANPGECFTMAVQAFDIAERFQTPVFVLSDLDIAMNDWRCPRFTWDDGYRPDRGKVLTAEQLDNMSQYFRYMDTDGDGIAARTLPGVHPRGAYFTRGSGHTKLGTYTEDADDYIEVMERLARKVDSAGDAVPQPVIINSSTGDARVGLVSLGSCDAALREAVDLMSARGLPVDYIRIRGFPFNAVVETFLLEHDVNFVIEQNRDAQLRSLLLLETAVSKDRLRSITDYGGVPLSAEVVIRGVLNGMGAGQERSIESVTPQHGAAE